MRKSLERRLNETQVTLELYQEAGLQNDKSAVFMRDMIGRMTRRKNMSTGQRRYLDSLIEQGAPKVHNAELVEKITEAISTPGMELSGQPLQDFRFKLSKGWKLSEKQLAFMNSLLDQADKLKAAGLPVLGDEEKHIVQQLITYGYGRGDYYWGHRPGHFRTWTNACAFFDTHGTLLPNDLSRLKNAFKGAYKTLTQPRFNVGDMCKAGMHNGIVMTLPYAAKNSQSLLVDILVNSDVKTFSEKTLGKRLAKHA